MKRRITGKMRKALPLLASGMTGAATALAVGVQASTVSEWLNHHESFQEELECLREAVTQQAMGQLQSTLPTAVEELQRIMTTSKTDAVRLKAAQFVIEACGLTKERSEAYLEPASRAELAVVGDILKTLGGCRAPS